MQLYILAQPIPSSVKFNATRSQTAVDPIATSLIIVLPLLLAIGVLVRRKYRAISFQIEPEVC